MSGLGAARPLVSVVLPCLNEAGSVAQVVTEAREGLRIGGYAGEVVVADNGSADGSPALAAAAGARVVRVPTRGYGAALAGGIAAAAGDICVMGDADATYPFDRLPELVEPLLADTADLVMGCRLESAAVARMPRLHRYVGTPVLTWLVRRAGGPSGVRDSQSGFRAFRRGAILDLQLRATGMEYASEMLVLAGRAGWRVSEVDTGYRERIGRSKLDTFSDGLRHLITILLLAPDLAATIPGTAAAVAGCLAVLWALVDPAIQNPGTLGWLASFLGPVMLVLGSQAILVGLLLSNRSRIAPRSHGPTWSALIAGYAIGGGWAILAGSIILAAIVVVRSLGLHAPVRAAQLGMIALVLLLVGSSAIAIALIARVLAEGARRYGQTGEGAPEPLPDNSGLAGTAPIAADGGGTVAHG